MWVSSFKKKPQQPIMQGGKMIRWRGFIYRGRHTCRCDFCLFNNRQEQAGELPNTKACQTPNTSAWKTNAGISFNWCLFQGENCAQKPSWFLIATRSSSWGWDPSSPSPSDQQGSFLPETALISTQAMRLGSRAGRLETEVGMGVLPTLQLIKVSFLAAFS